MYDPSNFETWRERRAEPSREEIAGGDRRGALNGARTVRLLLVDDRPDVRRGLGMWLALEPNLEVVGEAGGAAEAISLAQALRPDVVLMDLVMPGMDGISATVALRSVAPHSAVVILTLHDDAATRARAREAGAAAFVAKHRMEETLLAEIRRAAMAHEGKERT